MNNLLNNLNKRLILASNSPRRKEILKENGFVFDVIPSDYDEKISFKNYSKDIIENCAYNKALDVFEKIKADNNNKDKKTIIISADTVVISDNIILGKPACKQEAFKTLKNLSSKTHFVATSICLLLLNNSNIEKIIKDTQTTYVTFRNLKDDEIINYINSENPLDKAGSYGIQDKNFDFAVKIEGEYENVVGFPVQLFKKRLLEII